MITCDAVSVSLYRNTGVSLSRHAATHDFAGALSPHRAHIRHRPRLQGQLSAQIQPTQTANPQVSNPNPYLDQQVEPSQVAQEF